MNSSNNSQKKKYLSSYIYAVVVAVLVLACAVTIALVNNDSSKSNVAHVGDLSVPVATKQTFVLPMNGAQVMKDYSGTELQYNDTLKQWEIHKAIDFQAGEDKNVYAISNGTISNVYTNYLEGTVIEISHVDGLVSVYKSLDKEVQVSIGDSVSAGQIIGSVAESMAQELNSGNHLHFEMLQNGKKIDPNNYLPLGDK